jgi:hypothetical protein
MRRAVSDLLRRYDRFVPWIVFLLVAGGTFGVIQYLTVKLVR